MLLRVDAPKADNKTIIFQFFFVFHTKLVFPDCVFVNTLITEKDFFFLEMQLKIREFEYYIKQDNFSIPYSLRKC